MRKRIMVTLLLLLFVLTIPMMSASYSAKADSTESVFPALQRVAVYTGEALVGWVGCWNGVLFDIWVMSRVYALLSIPRREHLWSANDPMNLPFPAIGATTGVVFTGNLLGQKGSSTGALVGSIVGAVSSHFIKRTCCIFGWEPDVGPLLIHLTFPFASVGAVIGYNYKLLRSDKRELLYCLGTCATLLFLYAMGIHGKPVF